MKNWNSNELIKILVESAKVALLYYDRPLKEIKEDLSIVTIADKTIENNLAILFDNPDEQSYMIGEETCSKKDKNYINNALKNTAWIVVK